MISFIIIGRNESWKLTKCLKSVFDTIEYNKLGVYEVIYVDSKSTDDSIERAKKFTDIKIIKINGDCNPAIGRNVGASIAKGTFFYFIDGDMEVMPDFISHVFNRNYKMCYEFISGFYYNYCYNNNWELVEKNQYPFPSKLGIDYFEISNGGLMIISKRLWEHVGGMKNYLVRGADPDLGIRLAKKGIYKLRVNKPMAIHHTQKFHKKYNINKLFSKGFFVGNVLPYRENILSRPGLLTFIKYQLSLSLFSLLLLLSFLFGNYLLFTPYFLFQFLRAFRKRSKRSFSHFVFVIVKDIFLFFGLFFYWPSKKTKIEYKII